jgi:hypothetical protein
MSFYIRAKSSMNYVVAGLCISGFASLCLSCVEPGQFKNQLGVEFIPLETERYGGPGALVTGIASCTSAQRAGIMLGDIITFVGNQRITGSDLTTVLDGLPLNERITLDYRRGDEDLHATLTLAKVSTEPRARAFPYSGIGSWSAELGPAVILCIHPGSPADAAGLQKGDIILGIDGTAVNSWTFDDVLGNFDSGATILLDILNDDEKRQIPLELTDDEPPVERLEVRDVITSNEEIENVIDVEPIMIENCNGSETRISRRAFSRQQERKLDLAVNGELKVYGIVPLALAEGKIAAHFAYNNATNLSETKEEEMKAAPGTRVKYVIKWYEVTSRGEVRIAANGQVHDVPFSIARKLRVDVESSPATPCGSGS